MKIKIVWLDESHSPLEMASPSEGFFDVEKVLDPGFISRHSEFSSIEELFDESWLSTYEQNNLQKTANSQFDIFIQKTTNFSCWNDMVACAWKEFIKNRISDI